MTIGTPNAEIPPDAPSYKVFISDELGVQQERAKHAGAIGIPKPEFVREASEPVPLPPQISE